MGNLSPVSPPFRRPQLRPKAHDPMQTFAHIRQRTLRVCGTMETGWWATSSNEPDGRDVEFTVSIVDSAGHFLLVYQSLDESLFADTWHETLDEAYIAAADDLG